VGEALLHARTPHLPPSLAQAAMRAAQSQLTPPVARPTGGAACGRPPPQPPPPHTGPRLPSTPGFAAQAASPRPPAPPVRSLAGVVLPRPKSAVIKVAPDAVSTMVALLEEPSREGTGAAHRRGRCSRWEWP